MNLLNYVFFGLLIFFVHELGHFLTAKAYRVFDGFGKNWYSVYTKVKFPIKLKTYYFVGFSGFLFSLPLAVVLMAFYSDYFFGVFAWLASSIDLIILHMLVKTKKENNFSWDTVLKKPYGLVLNFRELTESELKKECEQKK